MHKFKQVRIISTISEDEKSLSYELVIYETDNEAREHARSCALAVLADIASLVVCVFPESTIEINPESLQLTIPNCESLIRHGVIGQLVESLSKNFQRVHYQTGEDEQQYMIMELDHEEAKGIVEIIENAYGIEVKVNGLPVVFVDLFYLADGKPEAERRINVKPLIHGRDEEDGEFNELYELEDLPYTALTETGELFKENS